MGATELSEAKQRARATWSAGDYPAAAELIASSGELCAERAALSGGEKVLDIACGVGQRDDPGREDRRRGHRARHHPRAARRRPRARPPTRESRSSGWRATPRTSRTRTSSFDVVISVFGVMFAPDHQRGGGRGRAGAQARRPHRALQLAPRRARRPLLRGHRVAHAAAAGGLPASRCCGGTGNTSPSCSRAPGSSPPSRRPSVRWDWESVDEVMEFFETKFGPVIMAKRALEPRGQVGGAPRRHASRLPEDEAARRHGQLPGRVPGQHRHQARLRSASRPRRRGPRRGAAWRPRSARGPRRRGRRAAARRGRGRR